MNVEIKEMPVFHVAGIRYVGPYGPGIGEAFGRLMAWAGPKGLCGAATLLGVYWDDPDVTPPEKCRSDACITVPEGTPVEGDVKLQTLPAGTYAVCRFEVSMEEIKTAWKDMVYGWLPKSGYEMCEAPCYEIYRNDCSRDPEGKCILDICVPVKPKS